MEQGHRPARRALEAVIFDLDGVLVDTEEMWDASRRGVTVQAGGQWQAEATAEMMGMSAPEWSRYMHERLGVKLDPPAISQAVVERMLERLHDGPPMLDGAAEVVTTLHEVWPLGVASSANRPVIEAVLRGAGLARYFEAVVSSEEVARGKPHPDVYLAAAEALGVAPSAAAGVEDSGNGIRSAAGAGMRVVAVPNRRYPPEPDALALADIVIGSLRELTPELLQGA